MLKNGIYNVIGGLLRMGLNFILIPLLIRSIGLEEFGVWTLISAVIGVAGLADGGLSITTTVFVSRYLGEKNYQGIRRSLTVIIGAILLLATLSSGMLWLGAESIATLFPKLNPSQQLELIRGLQIGSLLLWTRLGGQVLSGLEQAYQKYDLMNILITSQVVFTNLGILIITYLGGKVFEIVLYQGVISTLILLAHIWINYRLTKDVDLRYERDKQTAKEIASYSVAAWLGTLTGNLFNQIDRLVVGSFLGTKVVAIYTIITSICGQINGISSMPVQPILPLITNLIHGKDSDREKFKQQIKQALQISTLISFGIAVAIINLAPEIMNILVPTHSESDAFALQIAAIIYAIYSMNAVGYYVLLATRVKINTLIMALGSGISILLITAGSKAFGLIGAIAGNVGYTLTLIMLIFGMRNIQIQWHEWSKWLSIPVLWFMICIALGIMTTNQFLMRVILLTVESGFIIGWFLSMQKLVTKNIKL